MAPNLNQTQQILSNMTEAVRSLTGEVGELRGGFVALVGRVEGVERSAEAHHKAQHQAIERVHTAIQQADSHRIVCDERFKKLEVGKGGSSPLDPIDDAKSKLLKVAGFAALATGSVGILGTIAYNIFRAITGQPPVGGTP